MARFKSAVGWISSPFHLPTLLYSIVSIWLRDDGNIFFKKMRSEFNKLEAYIEHKKVEEHNLTNKIHTASIPH